MKRTTVFLPDDLHERLRAEAFAARVSMAELIRVRLERSPKRSRKPKPDPLAKVVGIIRDGKLSQDIDEGLYSV